MEYEIGQLKVRTFKIYGRKTRVEKGPVLCLCTPSTPRSGRSVSLWITRINAAVRAQGMTYSQFIGKVNAKGIALNRKVMADLAMNEPKAFEAIVKAVK